MAGLVGAFVAGASVTGVGAFVAGASLAGAVGAPAAGVSVSQYHRSGFL